jgi:hypothetical protein
MNEAQIEYFVNYIKSEYYFYSLEDIELFFKKGMSGEFEQGGYWKHNFGIDVLMRWLLLYENWRTSEKSRLSREESEMQKELDRNLFDFDTKEDIARLRQNASKINDEFIEKGKDNIANQINKLKQKFNAK